MLCRVRVRLLAAPIAVLVTALLAAPAGAITSIDVPVPGGMAPSVAAPGETIADLVGSGCRGSRGRVGSTSTATLHRALLCLVNRQRARAGRRALRVNSRLALAARRHAADMARRGYFDHMSPAGRSPMTRARAVGWRGSIGEVLASSCGSLSTPAATVAAWLASPPHRAVLLGHLKVAGTGIATNNDCGTKTYWVMNLG
jgi:uncharacterized protein YkwD